MKITKQSIQKSFVKTSKILKPLDQKQLERVFGGPDTSRGTETTVQIG